MSKKTEAEARIKINKLLEKSGWRLFGDENEGANVRLEPEVKITKNDIDSLGNDFEKTKKGYVDYLLLDEDNFPLAVLEAKREERNPLDGKEQARKYARSLNVNYVILSNGNIHYFWDLETGNPQLIREIPRQESLKGRKKVKRDIKKLSGEKIDEDYIAESQNLSVVKGPNWKTEKQKLSKRHNLKVLRDYQVQAIKVLQKTAKQGKERFLFEMATGTGKTLLSAAIIRLFLKTGNAQRVLFLVDRLELETQAEKNFVCLKQDYKTVVYKRNRSNWNTAEIVISTIQTLLAGDKYEKNFSPTDFDLLISDEAHRSLSGNSRAVFEYFIGYKLGLTATPKDYLKNTENLKEKNQRSWERRLLLDTYKTFGCESGEPTFKYGLIKGVEDGHLVNPIVVDGRTNITTRLLSEKGYEIQYEDENGEENEKIYRSRHFEKKFFSEKTNLVFCQSFLQHALRDPISGEIGKGIIFCVSQEHASKITKILNEIAQEIWPDKYNSDFAFQVTSHIQDSQQMTVNFANNRLGGYTSFLEGYKTSKARICVTVGMMTTGYDCQDILNLVMMRPIFSPTDFVQIKGRGTRKFPFKYKDKNGQEREFEKKEFKLFDFFANCEFFEEKFNYDESLRLPNKNSKDSQGQSDGISVPSIDEFKTFDPDAIKKISETPVGSEGMRVDREFWGKAKEEMYKDEELKQAVEAERWDAAVAIVRSKYDNKPELYMTLDKIRRSENLDRRLTWKEVLQRIFGHIVKFSSREELLEKAFKEFFSIHKPEERLYYPLRNYFRAYITDSNLREIIDKKNYAELYHSTGFTMQEFKSLNGNLPWREKVPEYIKDYVTLNLYME